MNTNSSLTQVAEHKLLQRFADLVGRDRTNTAQLLAHIAEIDERKVWAKHACSSMFAFCMERFHMSESVTAKRLWAARTARRFPVILLMVAKGELHLSGVNQLGKHLTEENHKAVLSRAKHKSSREIDLLVAELAPRPDVPSRVRAVPSRASTAAATTSTREEAGSKTQLGPASPAASASANASTTAPAPPAARNQIQVLAPRRFKIEITVDQDTHDQLRALQDLLRHQLPSADPAAIMSRAIELLLNETLKKKAAITGKSRTGAPAGTKRTRTIPAAIRREIWKRDLGRCAFVDTKGRRCRSTSCLEYHHEVPYGKGGPHELKNIALRCRAHNQYQADLDFGHEFMRGKRQGASTTFRAAC
ncbi:MAG: hypothetical protein ACI8TX_002638 [Hyphomicrobiaceae bacterium]|jgi:hypothetical protein